MTRMIATLVVSIALIAIVQACPYLASKALNARQKTFVSTSSEQIGPNCTQLAHTDWLPPSGRCQEDSTPPKFSPLLFDYPANSTIPTHEWPAYFELDFSVYYIADFSVAPPFDPPIPPSYSGFSSGHTYYDSTFEGAGAQRESYDTNCIKIFPEGPLFNVSYSCDFVILNSRKTAYLILHDDKPVGAPECCILGYPFHAPPRNFSSNMYIHKYSILPAEKTFIDWTGLTLDGAGLFNFGFFREKILIPHTNITTSVPNAFYVMGVPEEGATWMYQVFTNFFPSEKPVLGDFNVPTSCDTAVVCPGWSLSQSSSHQHMLPFMQ